MLCGGMTVAVRVRMRPATTDGPLADPVRFTELPTEGLPLQ